MIYVIRIKKQNISTCILPDEKLKKKCFKTKNKNEYLKAFEKHLIFYMTDIFLLKFTTNQVLVRINKKRGTD